jgi:hypothetical protein
MGLGRLVVTTPLVLAGVGGAAAASGPLLVVVQPADRFLSFGRTPFDQPGPTQRVLITNLGDSVGFEDDSISGPFQIIATGGGLGTGGVKYWDIACVPSAPGLFNSSGWLDIEVCGRSCEDDWRVSFHLDCEVGLLDSPPMVSLFAYAYTTARETVSFTNPGPDPLTVTGLAAHHPTFSAAPASAALPVTLAAGDSIDVAVAFDPTGTGDVHGYVDVIAGTVIAGRVIAIGDTRKQIEVAGFTELPLGSRYAMPVTVRNSYPTTRTIAAVTSDRRGDVVTGLAGVTLAPGEIATGQVIVAADELGSRQSFLALDFDVGQGDVAAFANFVVPATFAVTAGDATPDDGMIDFGAHRAGSAAIDRSFTITNLTAVDQPITDCTAPPAPFELVGPCPTVLPANGSVRLDVRFAPADAGHAGGVVSLNLASTRAISGRLRAQVLASQLARSAAELVFPDTMQGASTQRRVAISNLADDPITVPVAVTGAGFASSATELAIAARGTAEIAVEFAPAGPGMFTGALELGAAGDPDHAIIALSGTGLGGPQPPPGDGPGEMPGGDGGGDDGGGGAGGDSGRGGGGCDAGGGEGGLFIAMLALVRRRRP